MRFQHGVEDSPTRCPISATDNEASACSTARIFRSMASIRLMRRPRKSRAPRTEVENYSMAGPLEIARFECPLPGAETGQNRKRIQDLTAESGPELPAISPSTQARMRWYA